MNDQVPSELFYTHRWRHFTLDHDEGDAAEKFAKLYGAPPEYIVENGPTLWVGPIPKKDCDNGAQNYVGQNDHNQG
jgi:hypothetical protein